MKPGNLLKVLIPAEFMNSGRWGRFFKSAFPFGKALNI